MEKEKYAESAPEELPKKTIYIFIHVPKPLRRKVKASGEVTHRPRPLLFPFPHSLDPHTDYPPVREGGTRCNEHRRGAQLLDTSNSTRLFTLIGEHHQHARVKSSARQNSFLFSLTLTQNLRLVTHFLYVHQLGKLTDTMRKRNKKYTVIYKRRKNKKLSPLLLKATRVLTIRGFIEDDIALTSEGKMG